LCIKTDLIFIDIFFLFFHNQMGDGRKTVEISFCKQRKIIKFFFIEH
jgi:hypothetical protein